MSLAPHRVLVSERLYHAFDDPASVAAPLQQHQVQQRLAQQKDLLVQVMRDAPRQSHQEGRQEGTERGRAVLRQVPEHRLQEVKHVQRGAARLAERIHPFERRQYDLHQVDLQAPLRQLAEHLG